MQFTALVSVAIVLMGTASAQLWIPLNIPIPRPAPPSPAPAPAQNCPPCPAAPACPPPPACPPAPACPISQSSIQQGQQACSNVFPGSEPVFKADGSPKGCAPPGGFCTNQLQC
ncbi:hypothetical protein TMEN_5255 [Trichophyton mentagrophytes]|uniref:Uncharacterized protein n=3 Tax=Trichophyton TaxID=5550 RepID=A0A9P4YJH5_9EURO|nr:hypothetical protein TESG_00341 [Trichophyton tonsurans CBS 112818]EGE05383.1 hypothetical protein TEQG_04263 [Trichophyton equinum CBS 127.97]KAF3898193.1 hypothetical protein GY631_1221 [Trichophyton interdigitale]GBF62691.1 hypothetical protein TMEN_5255 [Trichophyton mentagrophytes]KAF3899931.1 hypothetical protein GY632_1039 [Trichophyton interdigitale]